jgi:hypothetical protein
MAIFTVPGRDIIRISDLDYENDQPNVSHKVHIIRLNFNEPNDTKMRWIIDKFYQTNRFVIDLKNIKYYNFYLKKTNIKYYVINTDIMWNGLISFYKRNNKVLLDITRLSDDERYFILNTSLSDILNNTEVIQIEKNDYVKHSDVINKWKGNCIIYNKEYVI